MKKFANWIANHNILIVVMSLVLLVPTIIGYYNTKINYDILVYLPEDIETVEGENILTEEFGIGAFSFVMTDKVNNRDLLLLEDKIKKIENVNQVLSIADIGGSTFPIEYMPEEILDKVYKDGQSIILVTFRTSTSDSETIDAVEKLREVVEDANTVSGMTAMVLDTMNLSNKEMLIYIVFAVILCFIVLLFATESYVIPLFLLGNIGFAILYNLGSNVVLGEISYITKAITAVLQLGVTMDFSIFLYHKYEAAKKNSKDKKGAMSTAIDQTFKSVLGSSLTTIAGFLALCGMNLTLGSDIGLVMAKGVICGLVCVLTLFPALLLTFDKAIEKTKHKSFLPSFEKFENFVIEHHALVIAIFLVLAIPAIIGNNNVHVYYKLDNSLPETLPCRVANTALKEKFDIVSPEIILLDKNVPATDIKKLKDDLSSVEGIDLVLAPTEVEALGMPSDFIPEDISSIVKNDHYQLLILNSTYEVASDELGDQLEEVKHITKEYDDKAIIAGEGALTEDLIRIADHDFLVVNYISIGVIFVLMLLVLKSLSLPFILVVVIELAIFMNMAIATFTGTSLPFIASIVVGTIQLGATIDYAILMSTTYLEEREKTKDKKQALKATLSKTFSSVIVSALCFFAATFGVAAYSKIDMIASICNLLSRGALISMASATLVLPALLFIFDKLIMKTTKNMKGCI